MTAARNQTNGTLSAGVVGVGSMGRHHARVYNELPDVTLRGVTDVDYHQRQTVADAYGVAAMEFDELLDAVDLVSIAVPTAFHFEVATQCFDAGVDVLIEKPLTDDPATGRELIDLAEAQGRTIQVGHIERFNPAVTVLDDIVPDLDVVAVTAERLGPPPDREIRDSAVIDLMVHDIDVVLSLIDSELSGVTAAGVDGNRYATATMQFENGVVGTLTASRLTQQKVRRLTITAREALVEVDYIDQSVEIHRHSYPEYVEQNGGVNYRHESIVERPAVDRSEPLKNELRSFVGAVRSGNEPVVTAADGLQVLEVAQEIERLAADGKTGAMKVLRP